MPWRNGGGTTTEIARHPAGDEPFDWRLSVADVAADGPFSRFDGIDRVIVLLSGAGMDLRGAGDAGGTVALRPPFGRHAFAGEVAVDATLVDGPTTDLNLMWRRDRWTATVDWLEAPCRIDVPAEPGSHLVVFVADGTARLPAGETLGHGDVVERSGSLILSGDASLLVFGLRPVAAAHP
ncbi:MAG: HutD family protein [Ilumatobacteraceae bacterium]